MENKITDEQLIALIEGESNPELEQLIEKKPELQKRFFELKEVLDTIASASEPEVPLHIHAHIQEAILEEQASLQKGFTWMHVAAAVVILVLGFSLGRMGNSAPDNSEELAGLKEEIQFLREATLTSSLQRHSASDRIMAVNRIDENKDANEKLIAVLVSTLNSDESPNVRYAAMQALANYMTLDEVRYELVKSLESQTDPLIQISLIALLVDAGEKSARGPMKQLIENEETSPEVKEQAKIALEVLV